jgi:VanZ family protein
MKRYWSLLSIVLTTTVCADDAFAPDKRAHFAGGVIAGGVGAALADRFVPEHRFVVGTLLGTLPGLAVEIGDSTNEAGFSAGDLAADFVGAMVGALATDKWILKPVVKMNSDHYLGVVYEIPL